MNAEDNGEQLIDACSGGNFPDVRSLVSSGASVNYQDGDGATSAICCCAEGHSEILQFLLEQGANARLAANYRWAPLHYAAVCNKCACVTVLLRHGVVVDAINTRGETALWLASLLGFLPIVELLVEGGADIELAANDGKTAIDIARERNHTGVAVYLETALKDSRWQRRSGLAMVRSSIRDVEDPNRAAVFRVLQCDDVAREIGSYVGSS
jgi:ankyrin repeat protein